MTYETLLNHVHIQMYVHLKLSFNVPFITHLAIKVKNLDPHINLHRELLTARQSRPQPHTHTYTDGMMSDPIGAATYRVLQSTSRTKMTCPDPGAPPTPAPDDSRAVY